MPVTSCSDTYTKSIFSGHVIITTIITQFKKDLSNRLASYKISNELLHCTDIACTSHRYEIDELFYKIVESYLLAEESHKIPTS